MTVLVTGANGFVGAAVCRALLQAGHDVRAMTRASSNTDNLQSLPVTIVQGDLRSFTSLRAAAIGCDALFHVAADYRLWVPDPQTMHETNVDGTERMIDAALQSGVGRIVYTSSVATLASGPHGVVANEETPTSADDMIGHYKRSKYLAEARVMQRIEQDGAPIVVVNPSTPIGPGDIKPTPTGRIVLDALRGRIPAYVDSGLNIVHVDDVAAGHLAAHERGAVGRRYILGGENLTLRELLTLVAHCGGRKPPSIAIPHGLAHLFARAAEAVAAVTGREPAATVDGVKMARNKMYYTSERAEAELGYRYRPAVEAVQDAVTWFQQRLTRQ